MWEIPKPGRRDIWFRFLLGLGALLGITLLGEAVATYYQVSQTLVTGALERDARRRVATIEREARLESPHDLTELNRVLQANRRDAPEAIAWIKVINISGETVAQEGSSVGPAFTSEQLRSNLRTGAAASDLRETRAGTVVVTALTAQFTLLPLAAETGPPPSVRGPTLYFVEIALYWDSATQSFGRLLRNLIISSSAALGLVATMVFLWFRFPRYVHGVQLEQQAALAHQVQADMLPQPGSRFANLDFAAEWVPAAEVGGDFYDAFPTKQSGFAIVVGDVSGKGLPAAVIVGLILGAVRTGDWMASSAAHQTATKNLSDLLMARTSEDRFASLFWCYYDSVSRILRYVNAGHPPPILVRHGVRGAREIQRLEEGGPILGVLSNGDYRQGMTPFGPGDLLVLYSDGVLEAERPDQEQFGDERILAAIAENAEKSCTEIRDEVLRRVHSFVAEGQPQDDLTLVVARLSPAGTGSAPHSESRDRMPAAGA